MEVEYIESISFSYIYLLSRFSQLAKNRLGQLDNLTLTLTSEITIHTTTYLFCSLPKIVLASSTISGLLDTSGSTDAFTGATEGWKPSTTRDSALPPSCGGGCGDC
jgi:hypothetical protein